jgi:uncharacterized repeat protein (TIGR04138 family)
MLNATFEDDVRKLCDKDDRYAPDAYFFIREALDFAVKYFKKPSDGPKRHVTGQELLDGIRQYALREYGPMALRVLDDWGIACTGDFGEIVFNLVDLGRLGKTDTDTPSDFADGYDFHEAFAAPFLARPEAEKRLRKTRSGGAPQKPPKQGGKRST